jgi:predicted transcriptional regulator
MRDERVHRLVVVDDRDAPIGVLSATDFVRLIADG